MTKKSKHCDTCCWFEEKHWCRLMQHYALEKDIACEEWEKIMSEAEAEKILKDYEKHSGFSKSWEEFVSEVVSNLSLTNKGGIR